MDLDQKQQLISLLHNKIAIDTELSNLLGEPRYLEETEHLISDIAEKYLILKEGEEIQTNISDLEDEDQEAPEIKKPVASKPKIAIRQDLLDDIEDL